MFSFIAFYGILHEFCSVLRCDILGIGLFSVQYWFKTIICSSVKMKKSHNIPLISFWFSLWTTHICSINWLFFPQHCVPPPDPIRHVQNLTSFPKHPTIWMGKLNSPEMVDSANTYAWMFSSVGFMMTVHCYKSRRQSAFTLAATGHKIAKQGTELLGLCKLNIIWS